MRCAKRQSGRVNFEPRMTQDECEEATFFLILACVCGVLFLIFA